MGIGKQEETNKKSIEVLCCYARRDQPLLLDLQAHLTPMVRKGLITLWADVDINAGAEWEQEIKRHLNSAQIILLFVSPDFIRSEYCYSIEMKRAIERHESGEACVIPIILRPVDWRSTSLGKLQVLPANAEPVTGQGWHTPDDALLNVTQSIARRVEQLLFQPTKITGEQMLEKSTVTENTVREQVINKPERKASKKQDRSQLSKWAKKILNDRTRWYKGQPVKRVAVSLLILFLIIGAVPAVPFAYGQMQPILCAKRAVNLQGCGSGLGISPTVIRRKEYRIGLNEDFKQQFDPTNADEKVIEDLILLQNNQAEKGGHFTLILATLLSNSTSDQYTGLEELRGALLAQQAYNNNHLIKMRLLVANLGVRAIADVSVPIVARQIAVYAANAPQSDHFLGVTGFPFSHTLLYGLPILQANQIPVVGTSPSDDQFSQSSGFHRVESSNSQQVKYLLIFIQNVLHPQKIMILTDSSDDFSTNLGNNLTMKLSNSINGVQTSSYIGGEKSSLDRAIGTIVSTNPDLLIFTGFPADLNTLKTDMIQRGLHLPQILGSQTLYELGAYTQPKPNLPSNYANLMFSSFAFPDEQSPPAEAFQQAYAHVFDPTQGSPGVYGKGRAGSQAALSHDATLAFQQAVDNLSANGTIPSMAMVSNELKTLPFFTGATGNIRFLPGSSDPDPATRPLEILCTNHKAQTQLLIKYYGNNDIQIVNLSLCN